MIQVVYQDDCAACRCDKEGARAELRIGVSLVLALHLLQHEVYTSSRTILVKKGMCEVQQLIAVADKNVSFPGQYHIYHLFLIYPSSIPLPASLPPPPRPFNPPLHSAVAGVRL